MQFFEFSKRDLWQREIIEKVLNIVSYDSNLLIGVDSRNLTTDILSLMNFSVLDKDTWSKLHFVNVEEKTDGSSILKLKRSLPNGHFLSFDLNVLDTALLLKKLDKDLRLYKQGKYIFDALILSVSIDGSVAGIYEGFNSEKMFNPKFLTAKTLIPQEEMKDRFTLTFSALQSAKEVILLAEGSKVLAMLKLMKQGDFQLHDSEKFPIVNLIKNVPTTVFALVD